MITDGNVAREGEGGRGMSAWMGKLTPRKRSLVEAAKEQGWLVTVTAKSHLKFTAPDGQVVTTQGAHGESYAAFVKTVKHLRAKGLVYEGEGLRHTSAARVGQGEDSEPTTITADDADLETLRPLTRPQLLDLLASSDRSLRRGTHDPIDPSGPNARCHKVADAITARLAQIAAAPTHEAAQTEETI
jgi:hypothetical protein